MRLAKSVVLEREEFARTFFSTNPSATLAAANAALTEKFTRAMQPKRLSAIRAEVLASVPVEGGDVAAEATVN